MIDTFTFLVISLLFPALSLFYNYVTTFDIGVLFVSPLPSVSAMAHFLSQNAR